MKMEDRYMDSKIIVTGTDIWYYFICKREAWLNIHKISPDQEDENIEIGRFIHEYRYGRNKKEIAVDAIRLDRVTRKDGTWVIMEIKKSSKFIQSSKFQLLFYLYILEEKGIVAKGELLFPEEKRKEYVELTEENRAEIENAILDIQELAKLSIPPEPVKIGFCRNCAYNEYCWAEV